MSGHTSWRQVQARRNAQAVMQKVAHDPGDPQITSHCAFCGSGQIVGRSDGNIECEFCGMVYLVRVQPMFTGMPGQPMGGGFGADSSVAPDLMAPEALGPDGAPMMSDDVPPDMLDPSLMGPDGMPMTDEEGMGEEGPPIPGEEGEDEEGGEGFPPDEEGDGGDEEEGDEDSEEESKPPAKSKKKSSLTAGLRGDTPENRKHYDRGWKASGGLPTQSEMNGGPSRLERADDRGEHEAWYDGYMDYAVGRGKYHSLKCPAADHDAPGCTDYETAKLYEPGAWSAPVRHVEGGYRTVAGDVLPEDAYIRHLAVLHGGIEVVRRAS